MKSALISINPGHFDFDFQVRFIISACWLLSVFVFFPCFNADNSFAAKVALNGTGKDQKLTTYFVIDLTFQLLKGFDLVLYFGVTVPVITPVISILELVVFGELVLICWRAWSLRIWLVSFKFETIGFTEVDLYEILSKDSFRGKLRGDQYQLTRALVVYQKEVLGTSI